MATGKVNTTSSVNKSTKSDAELAAEIKNAAKAFDGEKLVSVSIPKGLESKIGQTLYIGVNGVFVNLPVDGTKHEIPETLAAHLQDYLANFKY